jgi:hypothetical protein
MTFSKIAALVALLHTPFFGASRILLFSFDHKQVPSFQVPFVCARIIEKKKKKITIHSTNKAGCDVLVLCCNLN